MKVIRILRNVTIAGAAGFLCGKGYLVASNHPENVLPIVKLSAASGVVGALLGWGISAYRSLPTHVYTLSLGANFAVTSGVFFGIRRGILTWKDTLPSTDLTDPSTTKMQDDVSVAHGYLDATEHAQYISSTTSGGIAGVLASLVSRHSLKTIALTGSGGLVCGLCGQFLYNRIEMWRKRKAIEIHFPDLVEQKEKKWSFESMQERFLNFWHQSSKTVKWDMEIVLLEDAIREEKEKIAELDKALLKYGVEVKVDTELVGMTTRVEQHTDNLIALDDSNKVSSRTKESSSIV